MVTKAKIPSMIFFQLFGTTLISFQTSNNITPVSIYYNQLVQYDS